MQETAAAILKSALKNAEKKYMAEGFDAEEAERLAGLLRRSFAPEATEAERSKNMAAIRASYKSHGIKPEGLKL